MLFLCQDTVYGVAMFIKPTPIMMMSFYDQGTYLLSILNFVYGGISLVVSPR